MENQTLRQEQKQEAIERLKTLKVMPSVIEDFQTKDVVYYSERQSDIFCATLYWLKNHQEYVDLVKTFENRYNALVYHCQLTHTIDGDLLSLFYVSQHKDEWELDRQDLKEHIAMVRVENIDQEYGEFGTIGWRSAFGGVVRTA